MFFDSEIWVIPTRLSNAVSQPHSTFVRPPSSNVGWCLGALSSSVTPWSDSLQTVNVRSPQRGWWIAPIVRQCCARGLNGMAMPTFCVGSLGSIPGIASPVESSFAHGSETISQQVMFLLNPLAKLKRHDWIRVVRISLLKI